MDDAGETFCLMDDAGESLKRMDDAGERLNRMYYIHLVKMRNLKEDNCIDKNKTKGTKCTLPPVSI